jgi:hypothetical protein
MFAFVNAERSLLNSLNGDLFTLFGGLQPPGPNWLPAEKCVC